MKKIIYIFLTFTTSICFSQEIYKINYEFTDKIGYKCNSVLNTDNKEATYKIFDNRESGLTNTNDGNEIFIENDELSRFFYATERQTFSRFIALQEEIIYKDEISKINWVIMSQNKKKIGNYNCIEAKLTLNGRSFTTWFTLELPIKFGPLKLHKLPGLIVSVIEDNGNFKIELTGISKTKDLSEFNKNKQYFLKQKKIIDYSNYEQTIINLEFAGRMRQYNYIREIKMNPDAVSFDDNMRANEYLDIPVNLVNELKKAH